MPKAAAMGAVMRGAQAVSEDIAREIAARGRLPVLHLQLPVELLHELVLAGEVVVRVRGGEPGLGGDAAHGGGRVTLLPEEAQCGVEHHLPGLF